MRPSPPFDSNDPERTRAEQDAVAVANAAGRLARGSVLAGKYRLEMLLGEGGMACVWSAYHLELELPVAIKLLRAGSKNEKLAMRLRLEARAEARLAHPSIVRVFDVALTEDGDPFIVMELLAGESLAAMIARNCLSPVRAVQLLLPIAEALALAHAKGIVHRDLKPHNVFIAKDEGLVQAKLLDFGIAKLEHPIGRRLTDKGTVLGSPNYMSPEQVHGDDIDYRTDIWSFCVVLYKAVTGLLPFIGADPRATMTSILVDEPGPLPASIDPELARLILWGLAKDPAWRPRSMRELGSRLAQWLLSQGITEDACGTALSTKWLARASEPGPSPSAGSTVEPQPAPSARRHQKKRHRRWALLSAACLSLVSASLAWADSARPARAIAPSPWVSGRVASRSQSSSNRLAAKAAADAAVSRASPAIRSTVAPEPPRAARPKVKRSVRVRPPTAQLPF
jgi:serine/threonine protein kinase